MHQRLLIFAIALVGIAAAPGAAAQYAARPEITEQRVRCESTDGRERHCALDTRGGVRMVRQLSRSACIEGQGWGVERGGIWVAQGCRAEFEVGRGGNGPGDRRHRGQVVRCESDSGRSNVCAMDTRRGVELVRQLSRSACIREQSWGWNNRGVWVSGGCRAEFRSRAGGRDRDWNDEGPAQSVQSVRCESVDGRVSHCPVDTRGGVRMVRQLSRTACIEDRNWGFDRRGVWVEGGCRADFEVGNRHDQRWGGR